MATFRMSEWDTEHFGVPVGKMNPKDETEFFEDLNLLREVFPKVVISRVDSSQIGLIQTHAGQGFKYMDCLYYWKGPVPSKTLIDPKPLQLIDYEERHSGALKALAAEAFNKEYYSHFHSDSRFKTEDVVSLYIKWALNLARSSEPTTLALFENEVVGFATLNPFAPGIADVTLAGVSQSARGMGAYTCMVHRNMDLAAGLDYKEISISTQIQNLAVQKAWLKLGMKPYQSKVTMHWWR